MPGQLSLFGSRKQRGTRLPWPLEAELQKQTAEILRRWKSPGWRTTHFPAGGWRNVITATNLKRHGLTKGWADFLLLSPDIPMLHQLELKRHGEVLTDDQADMRMWCHRHGYPYEAADNLDDVLKILREWGAIRTRVSA